MPHAVAPSPSPASELDELEALIPEARARQRKRWFGAAALVAILAGGVLAIHSIAAATSSHAPVRVRGGASAGTNAGRCGARVVGRNRIVTPGGEVVYRDPYPGSMWHELRCSGSTVWAVFVNGIGTNVESYVGVRSLDGGRTWRVAFAQDPRVRRKYSIGPEVGPWMLRGKRAAYFLGTCGPCSVGKAYGTVSLTVTRDAGRTFRHYPVPALTGWAPRRMRVSGREVTIWASRLLRKINKPPFEIYSRKTVALRVA